MVKGLELKEKVRVLVFQSIVGLALYSQIFLSITSYLTKLDKYDVILRKIWLYNANPTIDWKTNTLTFSFSSKPLTITADNNKLNQLECNTIYIFRQQLAKAPTDELFTIHLNEIYT